jgi:zinc D-Ala-D-Ala carboxypeptidase
VTERGPSEHLSWKELACKDGTAYPAKWRTNRALALANAFEAIRSACGDKPIRIGSGYRTVAHNGAVGGAKGSQHLEGRALDLYPPKGLTITEFYRVIRAEARHTAIRGIGRYPSFVHVDIRPSDKVIVWKGKRAWAEVP